MYRILRSLSGVGLATCTLGLSAQALPTASGPGGYISVGGAYSGFQIQYGQHFLQGTLVYVDVNPHWRAGFEGEARYLKFNSSEQVTETQYLGGLRVQLLRPGRIEAYVKGMAGVGKLTFPFRYAHSSYFAASGGMGIDVSITDRLTLRALDIEHQSWPTFTFGDIHPYGISAGVSVRLTPISVYPRSR